jgi:hypothetical protein
VVAALCAALAVPAAGHAARSHYKVGVSDQQATTFASPNYKPLGLTVARYITPWDVMSLKRGAYERLALDQWIRAARAAKQDILISFEASHTRGHQRRVPKAGAYAKALKKFLKAYPYVHSISPWNEANRCQRRTSNGGYVGQPICHNPKMAAAYFDQAKKACRRCKVVALDVLDQNSVRSTLAYIRSFRHYAKRRPTLWGFHDYSDTNRFSSSRTRAMLRATGSGDVWLTETGGIVRFGRSFPYNPKRAAKALGCMFTIASSSRRIKRVYIYQFNGAGPQFDFDAGLVTPTGARRPGWTVVQKRRASACHK